MPGPGISAERAEADLAEQSRIRRTLVLPDIKPTPYSMIEVIFNHENLWGSRQGGRGGDGLDPERITYNFEDADEWAPLVSARMKEEGLPNAFYMPRRMAPKLPMDRLRSLESQVRLPVTPSRVSPPAMRLDAIAPPHHVSQVEGEIRTHMEIKRRQLKTSFNLYKGLVQRLEEALDFYEAQARGEIAETVRIDRTPISTAAAPHPPHPRRAAQSLGEEGIPEKLDKWERSLRERLPPGSEFSGQVANYSHTDAKKVRKFLMQEMAADVLSAPNIEFMLAVRVFAYHCSVCSVWVYFGTLEKEDRATRAKTK